MLVLLLALPLMADQHPNYDDDVKPVLRRYCLGCHGAAEARSGLNLETYQGILRGGSSGEAVVPGRASSSLLYQVIAQEKPGVPRMPLGGSKLPDPAIALIRDWIQLGSPENAKTPTKAVPITNYTPSQLNRPASPVMPGRLAVLHKEIIQHPHPVTALSASPWAPLVAVALHDRIALYNTVTQKSAGEIPFPEGIPFVIRFSRDGSKLLAAGGRPVQSGKVVLFDVATGKRLTTVGAETDEILAADLSPDGSLIALGGPSKTVKVYRTADASLAYSITKHTDWITAIEFSPDGSKLATGDRGAGLYLWEAPTGRIFVPLAEHKDAITAITWRADGGLLASGSEDGTLVIWNANDGFPVASVTPKPASGILAAAFSPDGAIATASRDNQLKLWTADGKPKASTPIDGIPVHIAVTQDGKLILAGDGQGRLWSWNGAKPITPFGLP